MSLKACFCLASKLVLSRVGTIINPAKINVLLHRIFIKADDVRNGVFDGKFPCLIFEKCHSRML